MFAAATVFAYGCSDNFDDSALWKDIDGMYKSLNELKAQVTTMSFHRAESSKLSLHP